ncbi:related to Probable zinc metalloprotease KLTH0C04972g [Saccharomycodes ludwigii]|uniref:Peptide hydrolase n=1 Tax=Saccharomycodes ludwigii TaxID=36035 RepID=A0A376B1P1_9ASCO|nr:hypothetical protein SCDLUD_003722 [Saccharomycodes ludwigii]KAH3900719.1 hypothetical protein SCDLUD_003722 [Saccharomycodes ludwigii]SSD58583.1 related to Probable zinc metalloprotease KLTH0C04972g [Saccharomycodes ludwigii]
MSPIRIDKATPEELSILDKAWVHLHQISKHPHPYSSGPENDHVHDYIYNSIEKIVQHIPNPDFISLSSDNVPNGASIVTPIKEIFKQQDVFDAASTATRVIYYESNNIVVKIEGLDPSLTKDDGLLFSAHFDSVPMANGVTDDGKGIVTMLSLFEYFAHNRPKRTLIFNFNNNEEFGLLGATIFNNYHPWKKLVKYVINLEGTGTGKGERAVLFRTSGIDTAQIYQKAVRDQPFGNSIYQQGFYNGYVHSETDYKIYESSLKGWDIAFYKPRDLYHTFKDSIIYTDKSSLFSMLHTTFQLSTYIANTEKLNDEKEETPAIYFDFGGKFFCFNSKKFTNINLLLLILAPILCIIAELVVKRNYYNAKGYTLFTWIKLPISLIISLGGLALLEKFLLNTNPMLPSRNFWILVILFTTSFVLLNYMCLRWNSTRNHGNVDSTGSGDSIQNNNCSNCDDILKTIFIIELNFVLWGILLYLTIENYKHEYKDTGIYPFTFIYFAYSIGSILGSLFDPYYHCSNGSQNNTTPQALEADVSSFNSTNHEPENRPLLNITSTTSNHTSYVNEDSHSVSSSHEDSSLYDNQIESISSNSFSHAVPGYYVWSIQFIVIVSISLFTVFTCGGLILDALNQTIQESSESTLKIFDLIMLISVFLGLPLLPFIMNLNYYAIISFFLLFLATLPLSINLAPFTESEPLKLRVADYRLLGIDGNLRKEIVVYGRDIDTNYLENYSSGGVDSTITSMSLIENVIGSLPSQSKQNNITCLPARDGNVRCSYEPFYRKNHRRNDTNSEGNTFEIQVISNNRLSPSRSKYEPVVVELKIRAKPNNRICNINFEKGNSLKRVTVKTTDDNTGKTFIKKEGYGIDEVQLHKLEYTGDTDYHVSIEWLPKILIDENVVVDDNTDSLHIDVSCFWGDYLSFSANGNSTNNKIDIISPGIYELLTYSPSNIIYTNLERGMVIAKLVDYKL